MTEMSNLGVNKQIFCKCQKLVLDLILNQKEKSFLSSQHNSIKNRISKMDLPIQLHCHQGLHFDQSKFKNCLNQLPILKILVRK